MNTLFRSEDGQDLIEYTLLLAFLVLASIATYMSISGDINAIWNGLATRLANP